jgi:multicomponent K+:H+ antiporter subunit E
MNSLVKALLPAPVMSALVFVTWLLLNETVDPAHLLLAAVLALVVPALTAPLRPGAPRIKRWGTVVQLGLTVLWDIVLANIEVARRILGPEAAIHPRFIWLPLSIRDPHGILALAGIITMTPGTLSSALSADRRYLLVHAFHVAGGAAGEADVVATIKQRYEKPLMEIFE